MKSFFLLPLFFMVLLSLPSYSQRQLDTETTDPEFDKTTNDIEQFVDDIVRHVESRLDDFVEQRNNSFINVEDTNVEEKESFDVITLNGDTEISEKDTIHGDLVVKNGALTVWGVVMGDVLVVNGDILLKSTSRIQGNARAMNGSITKEDGAFVEGYTEESNKNFSARRKKTQRAKYSYSFKPFMWFDKEYDNNFLFRYNRVEGFFFGLGAPKQYYWDGSKALSGYGCFGYGFASHKWRLQLGLDRQFSTSSGLYEVGAEAHSMTDTKDEWIMNLAENNLAALFFHEDFRDYFQREGFSLHTARYTKEGDITTLIDVRHNVDRYNSMERKASWAVFGGREFRSNPQVNKGMLRSISVTVAVNTVEKYRRQSEGWDAYAKGELGGRAIGGDFDFSQILVDIRRYQSLSDDDQIRMRLRVGSLEGMPIEQRIFELGGANSLPAYGFKEFVGNRMMLGNLEYQLSGEIIDEIFFWPDFLNFILLADAGAVVNVPTKREVYEGFDAFNAKEIKSDLGFALTWHNGDARLGFAWRTDKSAPVAVFFRMKKAF